MSGTTVGKVVFEVIADDKGDWYSKVKPVMITQSPLDYIKLAMLVAEVQRYIRDQIIVLNVDEGGKLKRLAEKIGRFQEQDEKPKKADVDSLQQPLPLKFEGTQTGRTSCDKPNLTEAPRDPDDT